MSDSIFQSFIRQNKLCLFQLPAFSKAFTAFTGLRHDHRVRRENRDITRACPNHSLAMKSWRTAEHLCMAPDSTISAGRQ